MGLFSFLRRRVFDAVGTSPHGALPQDAVNLRTASVVMACVEWVIRASQSTPLTLYRDEDPVDAHPALEPLLTPSPYVSQRQMIHMLIHDYLLFGNAYWYIDRSENPATLWYVAPDTIRVVSTKAAYVSAYEIYTGSHVSRVPIEDVIHIKHGIAVEDQRYGVSPIAAGVSDVDLDIQAAGTGSALLRNGGYPGMIISPASDDVDIPESQLPALKKRVTDQFAGLRAGSPMIMTRPTKVERLSFSPADLDLSRLRQIPEERITALLGIPASVIGFGTGLEQTKVGATMTEQRRMAWQDGVLPVQAIIAEALTDQFVWQYDTGVRLEFDTSEVGELQTDMSQQSARLTELYQGGLIMRSEARTELELPIMPDDDVFFVEPSGVDTDVVVDVPPVLGERRMPVLEARAEWTPSRIQQRLIEKLFTRRDAMAVGWAGMIDGVLIAYGQRIRSAYLELTETREGEGDLALRIVDRAGEGEWVDRSLQSPYQAHYRAMVNDTAGVVSETLGLAVSLPDDVARGIIATGGKRVGLVDIEGQARRSVFDILLDGREKGQGAGTIAERLASEVPGGRFGSPKNRALVISRTETAYAQNRSALASYSAAGFEQLRALDAQIGNTDPACIERNGKIFDGPDAEAELETEHPNGTLSFVPHIVDGD